MITNTLAAIAETMAGSFELRLMVKAAVAVLLGLGAVQLARRARASVRHLLLAATFGALLALPLVAALLPRVDLRIPVSPDRASPSVASARPTGPVVEPGPFAAPASGFSNPNRRALPTWPTALRAAWAAGTTVLLVWLGLALWRLARLRRSALPWLDAPEVARTLATEGRPGRPVDILLHEDAAAPLTCGLLRPAIVLPRQAAEWSPADVRRALVHELEHVRRGDWAVQLLARAACALYWFHPMVWTAWRQLCLEAERACDDAVIARADRTDYAEQLVSLARGLRRAPALPVPSMTTRSELSRRISALLDQDQRRGRAGRFAIAIAMVVASLAVLAIAPLRAVRAVTVVAEPVALDAGNPAHDRALLEAAERGRLEEIEKLLDAGANANAVIDGDGSPLIAAARAGHLTAMERLIAAGADVNRGVPGDGNPLTLAAERGHLEAVRLLLDRGANVDLGVPGDGNALIMAAGAGRIEVVRFLLDHGAGLETVVPGDENPLIHACESGQTEVVRLLVARGADVNARVWAEGGPGSSKGEWRTPLSMALRGGHQAVVDFLRSAGARD